MSKVVERAAAEQLHKYLANNKLLPRNQSAYRRYHSTEDLAGHSDGGRCPTSDTPGAGRSLGGVRLCRPQYIVATAPDQFRAERYCVGMDLLLVVRLYITDHILRAAV